MLFKFLTLEYVSRTPLAIPPSLCRSTLALLSATKTRFIANAALLAVWKRLCVRTLLLSVAVTYLRRRSGSRSSRDILNLRLRPRRGRQEKSRPRCRQRTSQRGNLFFFLPDVISGMMQRLKDINRLGIQVYDVKEDSYLNGIRLTS